jgi:hypothetical protein
MWSGQKLKGIPFSCEENTSTLEYLIDQSKVKERGMAMEIDVV